MTQKIVIICGPTGVGKTEIGLKLARDFNGEIISADSQQVYRGLDIGTAKPTKEEQSLVRHHLIDVVDPDETFDLAQYVKLADIAIKKIGQNGILPIVVGGTGLYIKGLCHGISESTGRDAKYRDHLMELKKEKGVEALYRLLEEKDPETASLLKPNDSTRIIRALEVFHVTGRSITVFNREHGFKACRYRTLKIGLTIDRADLYKRINERVDRMFEMGLLDEVGRLVEKYGADCPALKAVGYKEIANAIVPAGITVIDQIKQHTRNYAKRQLTWFKGDKEIVWF